jgi:hypothetical protein
VVKRVFEHGTIEIEDRKNGRVFKLNGHCLNIAYGQHVLAVEEIPLADPVYHH